MNYAHRSHPKELLHTCAPMDVQKKKEQQNQTETETPV